MDTCRPRAFRCESLAGWDRVLFVHSTKLPYSSCGGFVACLGCSTFSPASAEPSSGLPIRHFRFSAYRSFGLVPIGAVVQLVAGCLHSSCTPLTCAVCGVLLSRTPNPSLGFHPEFVHRHEPGPSAHRSMSVCMGAGQAPVTYIVAVCIH